MQVTRYRSRVSGPLLDRIDIQVEVPAVAYEALASPASGEPSEAVRERVNQARRVQVERFGATGIHANARMSARDVRRYCRVDAAAEQLLETAVTRLGLSARAYVRILKVGRTIADLAGSEDIRPPHIAEAIQYRQPGPAVGVARWSTSRIWTAEARRQDLPVKHSPRVRAATLPGPEPVGAERFGTR